MACLPFALLATACSSYYDTVRMARPLPALEQEVASSTETPGGHVLEHVIRRTALYSLSSDGIRVTKASADAPGTTAPAWVGTIGLADEDNVRSGRFVLRAGEEVMLAWRGDAPPPEPLRLLEWTSPRLVDESIAAGPSEIRLEEANGRWTLTAARSASASPMTVVQTMERRPTEYDCNIGRVSVHAIDFREVFWMCLFPPMIIFQVASEDFRRLGQKPVAFEEVITGEHLYPAGDRITYRAPTAKARYRLKLRLANTEASENIVTTGPNGIAALDFRDAIDAIGANIDFGRIGSLEVTELATGHAVVVAVDLLRLRDAARADSPADAGKSSNTQTIDR